MTKRNRLTAILLAALLCLSIILPTGCTSKEGGGDKLSIVTTIFPIYDWTREVLGGFDGAELSLLLDKGVDLHSFQPSADDIVSISTCDMFIYVGGESDEWVEEVLDGANNSEMVAINLIDVLGEKAKAEETVEGMQSDEEDEEEEDELDEHVWLSLKNAKLLCEYISEKLAEIDPENKAVYEKNTKEYEGELDALDSEYKAAASKAKTKTLLFADRFPFRYMVDDYGLSYYAAFAGCSAETEASFETIAFLADKVDELGLKTILRLESSNGSIAETIRSSTKEKNQKILTLNSMQSTTPKDIEAGASYLSVMTENLKALKKALV